MNADGVLLRHTLTVIYPIDLLVTGLSLASLYHQNLCLSLLAILKECRYRVRAWVGKRESILH